MSLVFYTIIIWLSQNTFLPLFVIFKPNFPHLTNTFLWDFWLFPVHTIIIIFVIVIVEIMLGHYGTFPFALIFVMNTKILIAKILWLHIKMQELFLHENSILMGFDTKYKCFFHKIIQLYLLATTSKSMQINQSSFHLIKQKKFRVPTFQFFKNVRSFLRAV